jgi:hypothetical protein
MKSPVEQKGSPRAQRQIALTAALSAVSHLVSLLSKEPALAASYREAKVAERALAWVATNMMANDEEGDVGDAPP